MTARHAPALPPTRPGSQGWRATAWRSFGLAAMLAVGACSSTPPTTFHTLMPVDAKAPTPVSGASGLAFRIDPVHVPAQVDRPQWVLRESSGGVRVLDQQRWVASLADEWRDALGAHLTARLGALDLTHAGTGTAQPAYRLQLEVQRFDTIPGDGVREDSVWTLIAPGGQPSVTCRSAVTQPAASDYAALAAAHRQALSALADAIAQTMRAMQSGGGGRCPG